MKQTAVEWLYVQMKKYCDDSNVPNDLLEQAREMEKEQIINAYIEASENFDDITKEIAEHFYKETYGK